MRIAVAGSVATDHLFTFEGRFADSLLAAQLDDVSLSFLASGLQVRRGGTGANIAFGMGVLGAQPVLVAAVGKDSGDYLAWLQGHGVDTTHVRVSADQASARFTCTTDRDSAQIATFFPGAMTEAAQIDLAGAGSVDLVVVSPDDPDAMLRHSDGCRKRGVPFAADPSQQLSFLGRDAIRRLVEGATYLFSNSYEAGLIHDKTGWSPEDVLELVGTRLTTAGADGVRISRKGEPELHVGAVRVSDLVDPTGAGDAFRAGFLTATGWGLGVERAAQVGAVLAAYAVEVVGPQEYSFTSAEFLARVEGSYGQQAAADVAGHLAPAG